LVNILKLNLDLRGVIGHEAVGMPLGIWPSGDHFQFTRLCGEIAVKCKYPKFYHRRRDRVSDEDKSLFGRKYSCPRRWDRFDGKLLKDSGGVCETLSIGDNINVELEASDASK